MKPQEVFERIHAPFFPRLIDGTWAHRHHVGPECEFVLKGPVDAEPSAVPEWLELEADASFLPIERVSGTAFRVTHEGRTFAPKKRPAVRGKGPVHAELLAVVHGLRDATDYSATRIRVSSDSLIAIRFLATMQRARQPAIVDVVHEAIELLNRYEVVRVRHLRTKHMRRVDRRARSAADAAGDRKAMTLARRLARLNERLERSKAVSIQFRGGRWIANGFVTVSIDPFGCSCPDWTTRWRAVPPAGRRKNRVPCMHLLKLGANQGHTPAELDERARATGELGPSDGA